MNLSILACLWSVLLLTLVLKSSTDFPWIDFSSTTCGYISKSDLLHLQMAFLFILTMHGLQTHYPDKWKWYLHSAAFYRTSSLLIQMLNSWSTHIYGHKKGKEAHNCIYVYIHRIFLTSILLHNLLVLHLKIFEYICSILLTNILPSIVSHWLILLIYQALD